MRPCVFRRIGVFDTLGLTWGSRSSLHPHEVPNVGVGGWAGDVGVVLEIPVDLAEPASLSSNLPHYRHPVSVVVEPAPSSSDPLPLRCEVGIPGIGYSTAGMAREGRCGRTLVGFA